MIIRRALRRIVFWFFIALFVIVGAYLTIKMLGYVIDTKHFRLTKAAGIYVKFTPRDATIYLDGLKYPGTSGYLSKDIYIPGLTPDTHTISLYKDGYYEWKKELTLEPGMVASAKDIILWQKQLTPETSSTNVSAFWLTKGGPLVKNGSGQLSINDTKIKGGSVVLSNSDSQYVVTRDGDVYYFIDLENASTPQNIVTTFNTLKRDQLNLPGAIKIREIISHPFSRTTLIVTTNTSVYLMDMKKIELEKLFTADKILAYATSNNSLFVVDYKGILTAINLILRLTNEYPLRLSFTTRIIADPEGSNLLITDAEKNAYLYEVDAETLKKMGTDVSFLSFAPDSKRAIVVSGVSDARILYLKDYGENVIRKKGDTSTFTFLQFEDPASFEWIPFTQNYFLVKSGNSTMIEEFDARSTRNTYPIANNATQFAVHDKTLYLLNNKGLLTSQKIGD
ncbi:MAG: hypothetical protein AAB920_00450 [Patescibacteria group bacterium]